MREYSLVPQGDATLAEHVLNAAELAAVQQSLWQLLARRVALFNAGDSSSVRVETAEELLASICFLLRLCLKEEGISLRDFASADAETVFTQAIEVVRKEIRRGKRLYRAACTNLPALENTSLSDTLRSLGTFWKRYDYRYFAHQIPCDIDYQLCCAVPESQCGIQYVNDYLSRLVIENHFLCRFPLDDAVGLLTAYCPDYRGLLINLFAPVLSNAVGLALLGQNCFRLRLTPEEQGELWRLFAPLSRSALQALLRGAGKTVSHQAGLRGAAATNYLVQAAEDLTFRVEAATAAGSVAGIFLSW